MSNQLELQNYEQVLYRIATRLSETEAKDIAILNGLEQRFQDERQFMILVQLERRQLVSENKPECLVNVLKHINRDDLAKESERLNAKLEKNKKKKPKQSKQQDKCYSDAVYDCAQFAIARTQIDQLATSLFNLQLGCSDAMTKLKEINKHLSRVEKENNLPPTDNYVRSFLNFTGDNDSTTSSASSSSPPSSLTGSQCNVFVQGEEERGLYEEMTYSGNTPQYHGRYSLPMATTSQLTAIVETIGTSYTESRTKPAESFIDFRPPQPAPKPPKKPKLIKTTETTTPSQSPQLRTVIPSSTACRVPLPGLINTGKPVSPPANTILSSNTTHHVVDDNTGDNTADTTGDDSGHGTGSGFSNVTPFLREPMVPKKTNKPPWSPQGHRPAHHQPSTHPQVAPKPVNYMPLMTAGRRSNSMDHGYTTLHQQNHPFVQQNLDSVNKQ